MGESDEERSTLVLYRKYKLEIKQEKWFRNGYKYEIMMKARSNTLRLAWREKGDEEKLCKLCRKEEETLKHFLLDCNLLQNIRNECVIMQKPRIEKEDEILQELLLFKNTCREKVQEYLNVVFKMYKSREKMYKMLE